MNKSKNDTAWEQIFEKHKIIQNIAAHGHALLTATEINQFREARLMTKFDHRSQLPKLFVDNHLSILPTSRGGYVIGSFDTFCDFNQDEIEITKIKFPTFLQSLDHTDITSEATAINCAFVSRILHDFTGETNLYPTVNGRMSSSFFDFNINSAQGLFKINVSNSQVEIDGGYEGDFSLNLIEAKNYISNDFLIRQLYYPYKLWHNKITKQVRSIFLTYTNGIFHLREYVFDDIDHYNSLRLVKQKKYTVQDISINIALIQNVLNTLKINKEPETPFPQADNFDRVINLCELLKHKETLTKTEITQNYDFDARQTDYYSNAAKYLGLIDIKKDNKHIICYLTKKGQILFNLPIGDRQIEFLKLILSHTAFNITLRQYLLTGNMPIKEEIVRIMKRAKLYKIDSNTTYFRRASTVNGWVNWIMKQIEDDELFLLKMRG